MTDLPALSLAELAGLLRGRELGAVELVTACLDAIQARESELHAWVRVDADGALARARKLDQLPTGERGPLHGVPVGIKDIVDTADLPTEYGSPIYADHQPGADAEVVAALRAAGAVVVGKTVTTEFALFQPGPTTNPHDPTRTPGGSSSGSAAAVAAGTVPLALGTQTAGSVVRPASFCGIVGVKPTFAAIPTRGVKECSASLDTVGVFTRDVDGAALTLEALAPGALAPDTPGRAPRQAARGHGGVQQQGDNVGPDRILRVGYARTSDWTLVDPAARERIDRAVERVAADLDVVEVELPPAFASLAEVQTCIMLVEVSRALAGERANHADQLSSRLREILAAGDRSAWAYDAARAHVRHCRQLLDEVFAPVDVLLAPSVRGEAPPLGEGTGDPVLCRPWTAVGTPVVAVPGLAGPAGLPLGVQVIAGLGQDYRALEGARQIAELLVP